MDCPTVVESESQASNGRPSALVMGNPEDPVRLYLASLRHVTAKHDDAELTLRVGRAETALARAVLGTPVAMRFVLRLCGRLEAGSRRLEPLPELGVGLQDDELSALLERLRVLFERQTALNREQAGRDQGLNVRVVACRRAASDLMLRLRPPRDTLRSAVREFRRYAAAHDQGEDWTHRPELFMSRHDVGQVVQAIARAESRVTQARLTLVEANLRLVVAIAKRYAKNGVQLLDLVQEGNLGLMRAAQRFECDKGSEFARYGAWWIRQAVQRALTFQKHPLRVPAHLIESTSRLRRVAGDLSQRLSREPTLEELARELELPLDKVRRVMQLPEPSLSLDAPSGYGATLLDALADDRVPLPLEASIAVDLAEQTHKALSTLTALERSVLCMRFGIGGEDERTLDEVGHAMGMRGERVRQLEARALGKLRHSDHAEELKRLLAP